MLVSSTTRTREEYHLHLRVVSLVLACKHDIALNLYRTIKICIEYKVESIDM